MNEQTQEHGLLFFWLKEALSQASACHIIVEYYFKLYYLCNRSWKERGRRNNKGVSHSATESDTIERKEKVCWNRKEKNLEAKLRWDNLS